MSANEWSSCIVNFASIGVYSWLTLWRGEAALARCDTGICSLDRADESAAVIRALYESSKGDVRKPQITRISEWGEKKTILSNCQSSFSDSNPLDPCHLWLENLKSLFRQDAETGTLEACATRKGNAST